MLPNTRIHDQLSNPQLPRHLLQPFPHQPRSPHKIPRPLPFLHRKIPHHPQFPQSIRRRSHRPSIPQPNPPLQQPHARRQKLRLLLRLRTHHPHCHRSLRPLAILPTSKPTHISLNRLPRLHRRKEVRKRIRQPELHRRRRAPHARPQHPHIRPTRHRRHHSHSRKRMTLRKIPIQKRQQLPNLLGKIILHRSSSAPPKRQHLRRSTPRSSANPQVHPPRIERMKRPKNLRNLQRSVMRQHNPTRPNPDPLRLRPNSRQHNLGSRTRQRIHRMVLRHPEPRKSQLIHPPRQRNRVLQSLTRRTTRGHRRLIQHRKPQQVLPISHHHWMTHPGSTNQIDDRRPLSLSSLLAMPYPLLPVFLSSPSMSKTRVNQGQSRGIVIRFNPLQWM